MQRRRSNEGAYASSADSDRDLYEQNPADPNFDAYRANRNPPWPRNEDRENYSAAPEYSRPDQYFDDGAASSSNRSYPSPREYGQSYGGQNANLQEPSHWRDNRSQHQAISDYPNRLNQNYYGPPGSRTPQYSVGQPNLDQPRFFQADDFSHRGGYTRSEYPEDSYLHYGQHAAGEYSMDNQQAVGTLNIQSWQEREGALRGAFGLRSTLRGRGPQGYTRSDERIKEDICERLSEHHYIDASQIRVEVSQGVVTLEGSVDDRWQKYQTEDLVDATSGVNDIQNRLNVSRASRQAAQWTSQTTAPLSPTVEQTTTGTTPQDSTTRKTTEKSAQNERGKPGFTSN
jgi:hypothetical protein